MIPNPGTEKALRMGCICPVMDNNHGQGFDIDGMPHFWRTAGCPLHDPPEKSEIPTEEDNCR